MATSVRVLGVRVDAVDTAGAVARIGALVEAGGHHQVATVNPEFIMLARRDPEFARILEAADLCLADGWGVTWAAKQLGVPLPGRVPGSDFLEPLAGFAAERGYRVFFLGAAAGVAEAAATALRRAHPRLQVAGCHAGEAGPEGDAESLALIREARPQILLVAYGHPKQELWIERNRLRAEVPVAMGVGGAFDFVSGRVPRAPAWMRRVGLEWLYRLGREPWRARRMAVLPAFAIRVLLAAGR